MHTTSPHTFHIPVMGIAFTIDSPIKVARFGINSAISVIEDNLVEVMRKYYYRQTAEKYIPISIREEDYRARRVTDYLDLMHRIVDSQMEKLKNSAMQTGSELMQYFEMLPTDSALRMKFEEWKITTDSDIKHKLENFLRKEVVPGAIEVNIMTKVDKDNHDKDKNIIENGSDALTALKGYAKSTLSNSALVFSAGMNPRLYNYLESFTEFDAFGWGEFHKRIIIKVSDYRSALIQGKYLAKKGIWVSEFRIESGLNCGGHVFATQGFLMGPILEEFKTKKQELIDEMFSLFNKSSEEKGKEIFAEPHPVKITVQGGIGTSEEDQFLHNNYKVDGTGWGTPFLLCPEATTVDTHTLQLLIKAKEEDVIMRSTASPLGVGFNYLKGTTSETERLERIERGRPGSPCTEKLLVSNTEFTKEPICTASHKYQKLKLKQLENLDISEGEFTRQRDEVLSKECLCIGLSNASALEYEMPFYKKQQAVTICPGPNIVNYSQSVSLSQMADHIYGRGDVMSNPERPNMFVAEIKLYIDFLKDQISQTSGPTKRNIKAWTDYCKNMLDGITHYTEVLTAGVLTNSNRIEKDLRTAQDAILDLQNKISEIHI